MLGGESMLDIHFKSMPNAKVGLLTNIGMAEQNLLDDFKRYYGHRLGRDENCRSPHYAYEAISLAISDG
jgi:glycogen phosphorylase